jgi:hypothetical protein
MITFKDFVNEMHGKGTIDTIGKHHSNLSKFANTKRNSAAISYHAVQRNRASRLKNIRDKNVPDHLVKMNHGFDHEDSKKAKNLKARIRPSDYHNK